jgi:predicted nucleotidyltransferase
MMPSIETIRTARRLANRQFETQPSIAFVEVWHGLLYRVRTIDKLPIPGIEMVGVIAVNRTEMYLCANRAGVAEWVQITETVDEKPKCKCSICTTFRPLIAKIDARLDGFDRAAFKVFIEAAHFEKIDRKIDAEALRPKGTP